MYVCAFANGLGVSKCVTFNVTSENKKLHFGPWFQVDAAEQTHKASHSRTPILCFHLFPSETYRPQDQRRRNLMGTENLQTATGLSIWSVGGYLIWFWKKHISKNPRGWGIKWQHSCGLTLKCENAQAGVFFKDLQKRLDGVKLRWSLSECYCCLSLYPYLWIHLKERRMRKSSKYLFFKMILWSCGICGSGHRFNNAITILISRCPCFQISLRETEKQHVSGLSASKQQNHSVV